MTKICIRCKEEKELDDFRNYSRNKDGKMSYCKICHTRISVEGNRKRKDIINENRRERRKIDLEWRERIAAIKKKSYWNKREASLLRQAKQALKRRGIECTITIEDIIIPEICPIFEIPFDRARYSPSLDRIDNSKGYVPGNVWVISRAANTIKNDGSIEELLTFCKNLPKFIKEKMI